MTTVRSAFFADAGAAPLASTAEEPLVGLRRSESDDDGLFSSNAIYVTDEPAPFTSHLLNGLKQEPHQLPGLTTMHHHGHYHQQQQQQQHLHGVFPPPSRAASSFGSPSTGSYSISSPDNSSIDESFTGFPFYPSHNPHPSTSSTATARAAPSSSSATKPRKRPRPAPSASTTSDPDPDAPRRLAGACNNCKRLKMKCEFSDAQADRCKRCITAGNDCVVTGRKPPSGPNIRERLLRDIRERDALIAALLARAYAPANATPLSIQWGRLDASSLARPGVPGSEPRADVLAWLDKAERGARRPWDGPLLPSESESESASDADSEDEDETPATAAPAVPPGPSPLGTIAQMSLHDAPGPTALETALAGGPAGLSPDALPMDDSVGVENPRFFFPGPGQNYGLRRIIIERTMPPEILEYGIVGPDDVEELFSLFFEKINPSMALLDPQLHSARQTYRRCPFLFTVVCAVAARYWQARPDVYPVAMQFAKKAAASALIDGWKSVEMVQAYLLLGDYAPAARRWEEDRSFLYKGLAIRIATDLALHAPAPGMSAREQRNRERAWLICWNVDRSGAAQFGKPASLPEDALVRSSRTWPNRDPETSLPFDEHLVAYTALLRLVGEFHEIVLDRGRGAMNRGIDYVAVTRIYDERLSAFREEWEARFARVEGAQEPEMRYRAALMPCIVNYCKLVMYSFGFQHAFARGLARGDPFFLRCWTAATGVVRCMAEVLAPSGFLTFAPECWFIFGAFASAFLHKLLRPEFGGMLDDAQRARVGALVGALADAFERCAVDGRHAPRLYARFLRGLVEKAASGSGAAEREGSAGSGSMEEGASQSTQTQTQQGMPTPAATPTTAPPAPFAFDGLAAAAPMDDAYATMFTDVDAEMQMPLATQALNGAAWWDTMLMPGFGFAAGGQAVDPAMYNPAMGFAGEEELRAALSGSSGGGPGMEETWGMF